MIPGLKIGLVIGASFAVGEVAGEKIADALTLGDDRVWSRRGIKIGTGLATYFLVSTLVGAS